MYFYGIFVYLNIVNYLNKDREKYFFHFQAFSFYCTTFFLLLLNNDTSVGQNLN